MDLQEVSDVLEVQKLRMKWSWAYDEPDFDSLVSLFADDAVCEYGAYGSWTGIDEIRAGYEAVLAKPDEGLGKAFATFHIAANGLVDVGGDSAKARFNLVDFVLDSPPEKLPLVYLGIYNDEYKRVDGEWKFARIELITYWAPHEGHTAGELKQAIAWNAQTGWS